MQLSFINFYITSLPRRQCTYLDDLKKDVVEQEPEQHVNEEEGEPTPVEDDRHGPRGQEPQQETLRDGLEEDGRGNHRGPQLTPPAPKKRNKEES